MIRIPADAPHIKIADLGKGKIIAVRKRLILVNYACISQLHNDKARRYLINRLWHMTQKK